MAVGQCGIEQLSGSPEPSLVLTSSSGHVDVASKDNNSHPNKFFVLISKMDPAATPLVFFPYPTFLAMERTCPPGYEGTA